MITLSEERLRAVLEDVLAHVLAERDAHLLDQLRELFGDASPATSPAPDLTEELASTKKMAEILTRVLGQEMSTKAFECFYDAHPELANNPRYCTRHGSRRRWRVTSVIAWFRRYYDRKNRED